MNMSNTTQQSLAKLKRLVRCLKRERQVGGIFSDGQWSKKWRRVQLHVGQAAKQPENLQAQA